jgi:energy-coupling factor transporter ATP-binding protein EcfA2
MIKRLNLGNFGKFTNVDFDFGKLTLFRGENEAGKTTIFDAIFDALCHPTGVSKEGKYLKARYGEGRVVFPEFDTEELSLETTEFRSLYAVGGSDLKVEFSSEVGWMDRVKAALFSGGIDPEQVKSTLETRASTIGSRRHNRQLTELQKDRDAQLELLEGLRAKREDILGGERRANPLRDRIAENEGTLQDFSEQRAALEKELSLERKIAERSRLDETLDLVGRRDKLVRDLGDLSNLEEDETEALDVLEDEVERADAALRSEKEGLVRTQAELEEMREKIRAGAEGLEKARKSGNEAAKLRVRIQSFRTESAPSATVAWRPAYLMAAAVGALAGLGYSLIGLSGSAATVGVLASVLWAIAFVVLSRKATKGDGSADEERFIGELSEDWRKAGGDLSGRVVALLEFDDVLVEAITQAKVLENEREQAEKGQVDLEEDVRLSAKRIGELADEVARKTSDLKGWFKKRGVVDRDDYIRKYSQRLELKKGIAEADTALSSRLDESECSGIDELQRECERKLRSSDEEGIPRKGKSDLELKQLENQSASLFKQIGDIERQIREDTGELKTSEGLVRGSLGGIPEEIFRTEMRVRDLDAMIRDNLLEREAAGLAAQIFGEISEGSDEVLSELGDEIGKEFQEIVGAGRQVVMENLDGTSIHLTDAGGKTRSVEDVSSGTRDSFMLAARLALAKRAADGERLLIFDEPFVAFDGKRLNHAVGMLRAFQDETGWQIIMLTKDDLVVEAFRRSFPEDTLVEHQLRS